LLNAALTANPIGLVVVGIAALVAGLVIAYKKSETFRAIVDKAFSVLKKVAGSVLSWFVGNVIPFFTRKLPAAFQAVLAWVKARWGQVRVILTEPMARALVALRATWDKITAKFKSARDWVAGAFRSAWAKVRDYLKNPIESARTLIQTWFTRITNNFKAVRDWVAGAFRTSWQRVRDFLKNPIEAARNLIQTWFSRITNNFKAVRDWVSGAFRTGWARVRDYLKNPIESARNFISTWFTRITNNFKAVRDWATNTFKASWARVASVLTSPVESARDKIQNIFGRGGPVRTAFSNAVAAIKTIWDGLEAAAKKPVRFVVNTVFAGMVRVINKIPGVKDFNVPNVKFARGGIMPGYTPGRDVHKFYSPTAGNLELSGGEPIMRPEFGQAVGKQWVDKYNHLAATGGVSAVKRAMMAPGQGNRFAGGGVFWPTVGRRTSTYAGHDGVDINQPPGPNFGAPIFAYRSGRITYAGSGRGYGNAVFEKADTGPTVVYGHMSRIRARAGQVVRGGQVIGNVGATGNASGPHLHFGIPGGSYSAAMGLLRGGKSTRGGSPGGSGNPGGYYDTVKQYPDFKDPTPGIRGSLAGWVNKLKGLGGFGPAMSGIPGNVFGKVFAAGGWVKKQISSALNAVKKVWHAVTSYSGAGTTAGGGGDGRLVPIMRAAFKFARETMGIKTIYGYSNRNIGGTNTKSDHAYGKALDLMGAKQAVADYFATGAGHRRFNIENTIYNRRIHNARGWHAYTGSSPHTDHVHIDTYDRGGMARGRGALMKNTLRPERVLSPGQTESFDRLVATLESRGNVGAAGPFINHAIIRETVDLDRYERQRAFRERMTNVG
jgi:murein DD-endopeptidase MepM/ murein hydrolase activator NlpD